MTDAVNSQKRPYHAPQRPAAAARTRGAVVAAAKDVFERLGWSGATMRAVADEAGVSVKTVEALYRTKAELLKTAVDYAIGGICARSRSSAANRSPLCRPHPTRPPCSGGTPARSVTSAA